MKIEFYEDTLEVEHIEKLDEFAKGIRQIYRHTRHCNRDTMNLRRLSEEIQFIIDENSKRVKE